MRSEPELTRRALILAAGACGLGAVGARAEVEAGPQPIEPDATTNAYPFAYHRAAFKASHNTEDRNEDVHESLVWHPSDKSTCGCRGIEFDIFYHGSDQNQGKSINYVQVYHDNKGFRPPLAAYLGYVASYHVKDPKHDVIFVSLDIQTEGGPIADFPDQFDIYLREWFDTSLLFTPKKLRYPDPPKLDAQNRLEKQEDIDFVKFVAEHGWPSVDSLQGKVIFCLSGNTEWKAAYAKTRPLERLCFADFSVANNKTFDPPTTGQQIFFNFHLYSENDKFWSASLAALQKKNLMTRGFYMDNPGLWKLAQEAGLNIYATNAISGKSWAQVGDKPFFDLTNKFQPRR